MKNCKKLLSAFIASTLLIASLGAAYAAPRINIRDRQVTRQQQQMVPQYNDRQRSESVTESTYRSQVTLLSSTPADNGTLSSSDSSITLQFSGDVSYNSSQTGTHILVIQYPRQNLPVTVAQNTSSSLTITPSGAFSESTGYTLYVLGLKDSNGYIIKSLTLKFNNGALPNTPTDNSSYSTPPPNNTQNHTYGSFSDVNNSFWAFEAISRLNKMGIIKGYSDNTFKPNGKVTRAEFASMFTKSLNLTSSDDTQTFADVPSSNWSYKAVEAAKSYLTGYKAGNELYFYGSRNAVREDMAVALVKALNLTLESNDTELQNTFVDYDKISPNLRDYVYTAYKNGVMTGNNEKKFNPQGTLTRAESAVLLERAMKSSGKIVVENSDSPEKIIVGN